MDSFVNPVYLERKTIAHIKQQFLSQRSIQLHHFLQQPIISFLQNKLKKCIWHHKYAPQIHSFFIPNPISRPIEELLALLDSDEWRTWLLLATGNGLKLKKQDLQSFRKGDYVLQHDVQDNGIHCLLELTNKWKSEWGGYTSLAKMGNEVIRINTIPNSLTLFEQKKGMVSFVKYINHHAENKKRFFIHGIYA